MKKSLLFFFIGAAVLLMASCYNDNLSEMVPASGVKGGTGAGTCDTAGVMSYTNHVLPVLQTNCGINNSCHGSNNSSGYNLSTYSGVRSVALSGKLVSSITWTGSASHMPQNAPKMSDCNITKIQKWVNAGSLNN